MPAKGQKGTTRIRNHDEKAQQLQTAVDAIKSGSLAPPKKRGRPVGSGGNVRLDCLPNQEAGDNTRFINHSLEIAKLPLPDLHSPEEVNDRCAVYFSICAKNDIKPSFAGLAFALGVQRTTLWALVNEQKKFDKNTEVGNLLKRWVGLLNSQMEDLMQAGKINPVVGIFLGKNNFGYTDQKEIVVSPSDPLGENAVENAKSVLDALPDET